MMEIEKESFLQRPRPMKTNPIWRDRNKYCRFHQDHSHNTKNCIQLKDAIEDLIKRGYLEKYVSSQETRIEAIAPTRVTEEIELPNQGPIDGRVGMLH